MKFSNKRYEEMVLMIFKSRQDNLEKIEDLMEQIRGLSYPSSYDFDEIEDYVQTLDANIHLPIWNKFPDTNPDMLKVNVIDGYYLTSCGNDFYKSYWRHGKFYILIQCDDEWVVDDGVKWWMPITFPTPY